MFRSGERTFRNGELTFRSGEPTFRIAEHRINLCKDTIIMAVMQTLCQLFTHLYDNLTHLNCIRNYSAGIILNTKTRSNKVFLAQGRYYEQQAAYKVHKVFPLQAFVATFKSLVVFVSKENLRFFVSLCSNIQDQLNSYYILCMEECKHISELIH